MEQLKPGKAQKETTTKKAGTKVKAIKTTKTSNAQPLPRQEARIVGGYVLML